MAYALGMALGYARRPVTKALYQVLDKAFTGNGFTGL